MNNLPSVQAANCSRSHLLKRYHTCRRFTAVGASFLLAGLLVCSAQSARPGWGSIPYRVGNQTGVTFRVWAPNATNVTVPGQFNGWSTTANPLVSEITNGAWSADIPGALPGQEYKYFINGSIWKRDPRNRECVSSSGNSIIYDTTAFDWTGDNSVTPSLDDLSSRCCCAHSRSTLLGAEPRPHHRSDRQGLWT